MGTEDRPDASKEMDEVICYAKNQNLGFLIPYTINGDQQNYCPTSRASATTTDGGRRSAQPDRGSHRREKSDKKPRSRRPNPLGAGGQQRWGLGALGVHRNP